VTYGTFRPGVDGTDSPPPDVVGRDFARMVANGFNAVRTYSVPPRWLLDVASAYGLCVMVGLAWEEHVAFLDDHRLARSIEDRVRASVEACAGHPAVLCYAVANEIPASIVRWHGHRKIERFLERLYQAAKAEDPDGLVTYVNYPSTEYLKTDFADVVCFNVYLESAEGFESYLARLHNLADDRPLVIAEMGLDSVRHGEEAQAQLLEREVRTIFESGGAGAFVFAWTDEWHRGGVDIEGWAFGLTTVDRRSKPALDAVGRAFRCVPVDPERWQPRISVVVCSHNGARTIGECCEGLLRLDYSDYEVIVVDDGSTDATPSIAGEYGFQVIRTQNRGLASARNTGLEVATGEIVAYLDDDAHPDSLWLRYLAETFESGPYAGAGGPNLPCPDDGALAECVANSPGRPVHVLLSDTEAEHLPGCNMAFRKEALNAVGGFDPQFRVAGDDVDVCWQLQRDGWLLGYSPSAVVWHHRRQSVRAYWKQQRGYGRAEALLERKWPAKYNAAGHLSWSGRLYGKGLVKELGPLRRRIRYGTWGNAAFQTVSPSRPRTLSLLPGMPEWYLLIVALGLLSALGVLWRPLFLTLPMLALAIGLLVGQALCGTACAGFAARDRSVTALLGMYALVFALHVLQPLARLIGRLGHGLTPWRQRGPSGFGPVWPRERAIWSEDWYSPTARLRAVGRALIDSGTPVLRGGDYDRWELEARGGIFGRARLRMALEEHGSGRQLARYRVWPRVKVLALALIAVFAPLSAAAALANATAAAVVLGVIGSGVAIWAIKECAGAMAAILRTLDDLPRRLEVSDRKAFEGDEHKCGAAVDRIDEPQAAERR
jgi:GT2 family glycosyltransferase